MDELEVQPLVKPLTIRRKKNVLDGPFSAFFLTYCFVFMYVDSDEWEIRRSDGDSYLICTPPQLSYISFEQENATGFNPFKKAKGIFIGFL